MNFDQAMAALRKGVEMRAAQKEFFKTRDRAVLMKSKALEKQFDAMAAAALTNTSDLFSEGSET